MLQHELLFASSFTPYRHHAGPCTDQSCRTHPRQNTTQELCTDCQHRIWPSQSQQVLPPGLQGEGSIGIYRRPESSPNAGIKDRQDFLGKGRQGTGSCRRAKRGRLCAAWVGSQSSLKSLSHTVIYCIPPGASRPLGMSHLLPAHSPALAHSSLPRQRTLQSHVLPSAKSHAVERRLRT